jgi:hypothetical protein
MTKLPPWQARNPRERQQMADWVNERLDELDEAKFNEGCNNSEEFRAFVGTWGSEIDAADRGNIEPLRKRLPQIARFLTAPPPRTKKKRQMLSPAEAAALNVKRIRDLWKKNYKRKNRRRDDGPSAIEIAALRSEVSVEKVERRLKPSGPSGKRKKVSRAE